MRDEYNIRELNPSKNPFEGLCGQSQKNSNVVAVMKKRKNAVFFRFLYCYTSINVVNYKYSYLQKYETIKRGA